MSAKKVFGHPRESYLDPKQRDAVTELQVTRGWQLVFSRREERRTERELDRQIVCGWTRDNHLLGNGSALAMKQKGLIWGEVPRLPESRRAVLRAELPKCCEP